MTINMYKLIMVVMQPDIEENGLFISLYFTVARQPGTHLIHVFKDTFF